MSRRRDELQLRRWLRYRGWRYWAVWRLVFWAILVGVAVVTAGKWYAYR